MHAEKKSYELKLCSTTKYIVTETPPNFECYEYKMILCKYLGLTHNFILSLSHLLYFFHTLSLPKYI